MDPAKDAASFAFCIFVGCMLVYLILWCKISEGKMGLSPSVASGAPQGLYPGGF